MRHGVTLAVAFALGLGAVPKAGVGPFAAAKTTRVTPSTARTAKVPAARAAWKVIAVSARGLAEVSGCAFSRSSPNRVWVHNDAGDGAIVVPVDVTTGRVGRSVTLAGVDAVNIEDIAMTSRGDIVLGDIGDNSESRASVRLYRFPEPAAEATSAVATTFDLRYPDGPHNAEGLAVSADGASAFIFTKDDSGVASVYRADISPSLADAPQVLTRVGRVTLSGESGPKANLVSAADATGSTLIVRSFQNGYVLVGAKGASIADTLRATPRKFTVPAMVQGEALCISPDGGTLVTASESQGAPTFALAVGPVPT